MREKPFFNSSVTLAGVMATRRSPGKLSLGTPMVRVEYGPAVKGGEVGISSSCGSEACEACRVRGTQSCRDSTRGRARLRVAGACVGVRWRLAEEVNARWNRTRPKVDVEVEEDVEADGRRARRQPARQMRLMLGGRG